MVRLQEQALEYGLGVGPLQKQLECHRLTSQSVIRTEQARRQQERVRVAGRRARRSTTTPETGAERSAVPQRRLLLCYARRMHGGSGVIRAAKRDHRDEHAYRSSLEHSRIIAPGWSSHMEAQKRGIADALERTGWRVESREPGDSWWEIEVWTLRSTWSPVEATCVLTFVAPPDPYPSGVDGWGVNVVASKGRLFDRRFAEMDSLYLGRGWEDRLAAFVDRLDMLRGVAE
jgi:hypothetical protein